MPKANSGQFVLATRMAPAARKRRTTMASSAVRWPVITRLPQVVGRSAVASTSFTVNTTPANGGTGSPA